MVLPVAPVVADDRMTCADASGDEAIAACTRAIEAKKAKGHDLAELYFYRGFEFHNKEDYDRAIAEFDQAIRADPEYAEAYSARGWSLVNRGDLDRALADYNEAIRLDPESALALTRRGYAWYCKGDLPRAFADYDEAIRLGPEKPYYERGNAWYDIGELDRAIADYDRYILLHPTFAGAYIRRGDARKGRGELDRAIADYDRAIRLDPQDASARERRRLALEVRRGTEELSQRSIAAAEAEGLALFKAAGQATAINNDVIEETRRKISDFCDFDYMPVLVTQPNGTRATYFLARSMRPDDIVFGRHFKVVGSDVTTSTKTCFNAGSPPANSAAAFITHLLSPSPTEFHVYLSLQHKKPIYVATSAGDWLVENGRVRFLKKR